MEYNDRALACVDLRDADPRNYWIHGSFDPDLIEVARQIIGKKGVVWDIGANFGLFSFGLIPWLDSSSRFDLFEANPQLQIPLQASRSLQDKMERVHLHPYGVGRSEGKLHFQIDRKNLGASYVSDSGGMEISVISLDDFFKKNSIEKVDFMKLDVEGYEYEVLEGAADLLKDRKIAVIHCEISQENQKRRGRTTSDLSQLMKGYGYGAFFYKKSDMEFSKGIQSVYQFPGGKLLLGEVKSFENIIQTDLLFIPMGSLSVKN